MAAPTIAAIVSLSRVSLTALIIACSGDWLTEADFETSRISRSTSRCEPQRKPARGRTVVVSNDRTSGSEPVLNAESALRGPSGTRASILPSVSAADQGQRGLSGPLHAEQLGLDEPPQREPGAPPSRGRRIPPTRTSCSPTPSTSRSCVLPAPARPRLAKVRNRHRASRSPSSRRREEQPLVRSRGGESSPESRLGESDASAAAPPAPRAARCLTGCRRGCRLPWSAGSRGRSTRAPEAGRSCRCPGRGLSRFLLNFGWRAPEVAAPPLPSRQSVSATHRRPGRPGKCAEPLARRTAARLFSSFRRHDS